jgi:putative effector of murein hydrolase LrgA (UPF0299 family)
MIASLSLVLLCQLAGEVIVRGLALPMPGPVVGLVFLLLLLLARDRFGVLARGPLQQDGVENASRGLLGHLSLAPKSVTAGIAMGISESLHADPSLTAVAVILTGIMGAIIVTPLMNRIGITDFRARGFAVGLAAHGIGTARAFQVDAVAGVFAGVAMSLNALMTSLLVPLAATLLVY